MKLDTQTIFLEIYAKLESDSQIDPNTMPEDMYSLLVSRSALLHWTGTGAGDLWQMNDAGSDLASRNIDSSCRVLWYQVNPSEVSIARQIFPIQPLFTCAEQSLRRIGTIKTLVGSQVLIPVQLVQGGISALAGGLNWFNLSPDKGILASVSLDSGTTEEITSRSDAIFRLLQDRNTGPFRVLGYNIVGPKQSLHHQPTVTDPWLGRTSRSVTFKTSLPEWSFDSLGFVSALFSQVCSEVKVPTSVRMSIQRLP